MGSVTVQTGPHAYRSPTPEEMRALGIATRAGWRKTLEQALLRAAHEDVRSPSTVARAREVLRREMAETQQLNHWLSAVHQDPMVRTALFELAKKSRAAAVGKPLEVTAVLAESATERLELRARGTMLPIDGELSDVKFRLVDRATGRGRDPTAGDCHRLDFDRAAQLIARIRQLAGAHDDPSFDTKVALFRHVQGATGAPPDPLRQELDAHRRSIGAEELILVGDEQHGILLDRFGKLGANYGASIGWGRPISPSDLEQRGLRSVADWDAALVAAARRYAGSANPNLDPIRALAQRTAEIQSYLTALRGHAGAEALMKQHASRHDAERLPARFLAEDAKSALLWHDGSVHTVSAEQAPRLKLIRGEASKLEWFDEKGDDSYAELHRYGRTDLRLTPTTYSELARFGLTDLSRFEAHLQNLSTAP
jgi:hypothetical protein